MPADLDELLARADRVLLIGNAHMQLEGEEGVDYIDERPLLQVVAGGRDDAS